MLPPKLKLLTAVISAILAVPAGHADELLDMSLADLLDQTITTASRQEESTADAPGTVLVITQQQIRERGYVNLYQLLEDQPGVDVQSYASNQEFNKIAIRGITRNDKFIIMQNGVRINAPTGEPVPVSDNFPLYHAKQVEIVYGPASALYGADAFTGVINIITETAQDLNGAEVTLIGGDVGSRAVYANAGKKLNENVSISGGAHWQASDNPNLAEYYPQDFALNDLVTFGGTTVVKAEDRQGYVGDTKSQSAYLKLDLGEHFSLGGNYSFFRHHTSTNAKPDTVDYGANANWYTTLADVYAHYRADLTPKLKGFVQLDYSWYEADPESKFANIYVNFSDGYKYARGERTQLETQFDYSLDDANSVIAGFSVADHFSQPKPVDLPRPYNPDQDPSEQSIFYLGTQDTLPANIYQSNDTNLGGYLQWRRLWSEKLTSTLGIRYDHSANYGSTVNPRLGLVYKASPQTTLKLLYGSAFLAPSALLAYEHYGSFSGQTDADGRYTSDFFNIPNPGLRPEKVQTLEMNLAHRFNPNLELRASLYYNRAKDIIFAAPADPQQPDYIAGGVIGYTQYNANLGKENAYGGDLSLDYLHRIDAASNLKFWGNYSYTDGDLEREGQGYSTALPNVAPHKIKLGLTYNYKQFSLSPKLLWIGDTASAQTAADDPSQALQANAYTRLDLHAEWAALANLRLFVNVSNLLDRRYYQVTDDVSASFVRSPQDPRRVYLGLAYKFE